MASDDLLPHAGLAGTLGACFAADGFTATDFAPDDALVIAIAPLSAEGTLPLLDEPFFAGGKCPLPGDPDGIAADGFQVDAVTLS